MHSENALFIRAPAQRIYELAARVERWPEILPHYRWVRVLSGEGRRRVVEMAARRDFIPVWWCAEQQLFPEEPRIAFRHVRGITRGMEVEWLFEPRDGGTLVRIRHELRFPIPFVAEAVIGPYFVSNVAGKTLARIKELAEA